MQYPVVLRVRKPRHKLSCQYFLIQSPNSCIVVVCVCIHPSMVLQPLPGPGLPQMMSPFLSVFRSWYACVCVCVCVYIYVNNFQIWLCEVMESYSVSVYTKSATLLLYHTSNTICNGAGIKKKLRPMHKYWQ